MLDGAMSSDPAAGLAGLRKAGETAGSGRRAAARSHWGPAATLWQVVRGLKLERAGPGRVPPPERERTGGGRRHIEAAYEESVKHTPRRVGPLEAPTPAVDASIGSDQASDLSLHGADGTDPLLSSLFQGEGPGGGFSHSPTGAVRGEACCAASRRRVADRWALLPPASLLVGIVVLWGVLSAYGIIPSYILPSPGAIGLEVENRWPVLLKHAGATTLEAVSGFLIGNTVAVAIAALFTLSPILKDAFYPYALMSRAMPIVVFTPLFVVMLGRGLPPIIAIVSFAVYFPTFLNMMGGLDAVDVDQEELLHTLWATPLQRLRLIQFPASMPYLFAAMKVSASGAFIASLVTEWIGANTGLGYLVVVSSQFFKLPTMWASIFASALLTLALLGIVTLVERALALDRHGQRALSGAAAMASELRPTFSRSTRPRPWHRQPPAGARISRTASCAKSCCPLWCSSPCSAPGNTSPLRVTFPG